MVIDISSCKCVGITPVGEVDPESGIMDFRVGYVAKITGEVPSSYRAINTLVQSFCDNNIAALEAMCENPVKSYFKYLNIELETIEGSIWQEQVDYIVLVSEDKDEVCFHLELSFDAE